MTPDDELRVMRPPMTRRSLLINSGVVVAVLAAILCLLLPAVCRVREAEARIRDANNLKQLVLAEHNFSDTNAEIGIIGPYAQDWQGVLNTQLSFRASLLPYIESGPYPRLEMSQPWDSVRNAPITTIPFKLFQSPDTPDATKPDTPYRVFYGGGALFAADGTPVKLTDIPDGASSTILFVHATETVPWAKPQEFAYTPTTPLPPLGSPGLGKGFNAAMADGSVRFLRHTIAEADLRSLIEKADGRGRDIE